MSKRLQIKCWMALFAILGFIVANTCGQATQDQVNNSLTEIFQDLKEEL